MSKNSILYSTDGLEDLTQESAAAYSGGTLTLYYGSLLSGDSFTTEVSRPNLGPFTGLQPSSASVARFSQWELYREVNYRGPGVTINPGLYNLRNGTKVSSVLRRR